LEVNGRSVKVDWIHFHTATDRKGRQVLLAIPMLDAGYHGLLKASDQYKNVVGRLPDNSFRKVSTAELNGLGITEALIADAALRLEVVGLLEKEGLEVDAETLDTAVRELGNEPSLEQLEEVVNTLSYDASTVTEEIQMAEKEIKLTRRDVEEILEARGVGQTKPTDPYEMLKPDGTPDSLALERWAKEHRPDAIAQKRREEAARAAEESEALFEVPKEKGKDPYEMVREDGSPDSIQLAEFKKTHMPQEERL
jgi:hypothetical protein